MTATKSMTARLAAIMGDVGRIEKRGQIRSQGGGPSYNFARDTDVLEAVIPKLVEAGIVIVPERTELLSIEPNMRGSQLIANIKTAWHVTDGNESIRFETLGQGQDGGDKALPKAQSNARKYAFFMLFHIVTGDDPDQHASEDGRRPAQSRRPIQQPGQASDNGAAAARAASGSEAQPASVDKTFTNRGQIQQAIVEAAHAQGMTIRAIEDKAKELGIERGEATMEQLLVLLVAIERGEPEREAAEAVA